MQLPRCLTILAVMATLTSADVITDKRRCYEAGDSWGKNLEDTIDVVDNWCIHDGRGDYFPGRVKYRCQDLPHDDSKVELWIQRTVNGPAELDLGRCAEMLKNQIYRCERGGEGTGDGWFFRARIKKGVCALRR